MSAADRIFELKDDDQPTLRIERIADAPLLRVYFGNGKNPRTSRTLGGTEILELSAVLDEFIEGHRL